MTIIRNNFARSVCYKPTANRLSVRRQNQQAAVFCHLGRMLWQLSRRIPWSRLTQEERLAVHEAAERIIGAAETAKAACDRD